jgi:hypothetical protein
LGHRWEKGRRGNPRRADPASASFDFSMPPASLITPLSNFYFEYNQQTIAIFRRRNQLCNFPLLISEARLLFEDLGG